jgi:hypothetical protein
MLFCAMKIYQNVRMIQYTLNIYRKSVHLIARISFMVQRFTCDRDIFIRCCRTVILLSHTHTSGSGEGPRSRRYGRTAALRLLVQPCDEDGDDDYYFLSFFLVMDHRWNEIGRGKPKYSGKNLSQCHFVHHKSHAD